jgi:hypothetical protein
MNRRTFSTAASGALALALMHLPVSVNACTACMGDPNSKTAGAINAAIFLMLGVLALMLGSFVVFAFYLSRRANAGGAVLPVDSGASSEADTFT